jgi:hypothetical protein
LPKVLLWVFQALSLYVFYLIHRILFYFSPKKLFLEEVQDDEIQTPEVIPPGKVNVIVCVKRSKADSSSEISLLSLPYWVLVRVKMLLCETEINDEDLFIVL